MVYFKVNALLQQLIRLAKVQKSFVGCSQICDRQIVSVTDLQLCLRAIKQEIGELSALIETEEKKSEEAKNANKAKEKQ